MDQTEPTKTVTLTDTQWEDVQIAIANFCATTTLARLHEVYRELETEIDRQLATQEKRP